MIAEFLGAGGVGKSTVEPLVSARLGIAYYPGKKRHGFEGEPLPSWKVWWGRVASIGSRPGLLLASLRAHKGPAAERVRFAVDLARRDRFARRAARLGSGVVASGPLHGLAMATAATGSDFSHLTGQIATADVYVMLSAQSDVIEERLRKRWSDSGLELPADARWVSRYEQAASALVAASGKPVIEVDATPAPDQVADQVARGLKPLVESR
jgi:hypothetical protein